MTWSSRPTTSPSSKRSPASDKLLGLEVVAEGVETHQQLEIVRRIGCDLIQGFYFSMPVLGAQLESLLEDCAFPRELAA